jgi:Ca2+-binding EF-hand superfamily protein
MGNSQSGDCLFTAAVAKYMHLTKHQVILLQAATARRAKGASIKRKLFMRALDEVNVSKEPDRDILINLFTMWDLSGTGRVPAHEFIVGLSPLACGGESISTILSFALQIMDLEGNGRVSASEALVMLKSKYTCRN